MINQMTKQTTISQTKQARALITIGIMLVMFLVSLDMLIVANALPRIAQLLNGASNQTWVITVYTLAMTVTVPVAGKLSDIFGRKHLYVIGIVWFTIGSTLCALAGSMLQLIVFRGIQGIGGGIIMGISMAIIADVFPPAEVGKYMGIIMSMSSLASLIGPSLGGVIVDHIGWHWIFLLNVPAGLAAAAVLSIGLPALQKRDANSRVDFAGAGLIIAFTVPLMLGLTWGGKANNGGYAWNSPMVLILFTVAAVSLAALIWVESRVDQPIIPMAYFKRSVFTVANSANFAITIAMFGTMVFMPQFCQYLLGYSPTKSGGLQTPLMVCMMIMSIIVGQLVSRLGKYKIFTVGGSLIAVATCLLLTTLNQTSSDAKIIWIMVLFGFGMGALFPPLTIALQNTFSKTEIGAATASFQFIKNFATSLGVAILGATLTGTQTALTTARQSAIVDAGNDPAALNAVKVGILSDSFHVVFIICTVFAAIALVASLFLKEVPLRHDTDTSPAEAADPTDIPDIPEATLTETR